MNACTLKATQEKVHGGVHGSLVDQWSWNWKVLVVKPSQCANACCQGINTHYQVPWRGLQAAICSIECHQMNAACILESYL